MGQNPKLIIHKQKLLHNMKTLVYSAHAQGVRIALVSKVVCAHPAAIDCINQSGADMLADSRAENLNAADSKLPKLMLRIGMPEAAEEIVRASDISLESEIDTILALEKAAAKLDKKHRVILMIDLGDLREGIFFKDRDQILAAADFAQRFDDRDAPGDARFIAHIDVGGRGGGEELLAELGQ